MFDAAAIVSDFEEKYQEAIKESYVHAAADAWPQVSFSMPIQAETDCGAMINSGQGEFLSKIVICGPAEFDAVYDACIPDTLNVDAAEVIDTQREIYRNGNFRGAFPGNM